MKVSVTYTDDNGAPTTGSKEIKLEVLKNPVTITASADYTNAVGGKYIAYGTALSDVELTGTATSNGETVTGTFTWAQPDTVPLGANNGDALYMVLFTPDEAYASSCSTAETTVAVNTQIGLQLKVDAVPDSIEYMGRTLNVDNSDECVTYVTDIDTGDRIDGVSISLTGAVLQQSQITPGTATVWLTEVSGCTPAILTRICTPLLVQPVRKTAIRLPLPGRHRFLAAQRNTLLILEAA